MRRKISAPIEGSTADEPSAASMLACCVRAGGGGGDALGEALGMARVCVCVSRVARARPAVTRLAGREGNRVAVGDQLLEHPS